MVVYLNARLTESHVDPLLLSNDSHLTYIVDWLRKIKTKLIRPSKLENQYTIQVNLDITFTDEYNAIAASDLIRYLRNFQGGNRQHVSLNSIFLLLAWINLIKFNEKEYKTRAIFKFSLPPSISTVPDRQSFELDLRQLGLAGSGRADIEYIPLIGTSVPLIDDQSGPSFVGLSDPSPFVIKEDIGWDIRG